MRGTGAVVASHIRDEGDHVIDSLDEVIGIARELGIPAVVGCGHATERLKDGMLVTVSCAQGDTGFIYDGLLETEVTEVQRGTMPEIPVKIMMNVGNPQLAFDFCQLPNEGVGLARLEFIINNNIGVHP